MEDVRNDRRRFLRSAGSALVASGAASTLALSAGSARAAHHEAVTQTKESQAAITPEQALQKLKDGNERFVQGKMFSRNLLQQVKATGAGQFPFAAVVGCIDSRESAQVNFDQGVGDLYHGSRGGKLRQRRYPGQLGIRLRGCRSEVHSCRRSL